MSYIIFERKEDFFAADVYSVTMNRRVILSGCTCQNSECPLSNAEIRAPFWGPDSKEEDRRLVGMAVTLELMRNSGVDLTPDQQFLSANHIAEWLEKVDTSFWACGRQTLLENCKLDQLIKAGLHKVKEVARG